MRFVFMTLVSCRSERIPRLLLVPVDEFRVGADRCAGPRVATTSSWTAIGCTASRLTHAATINGPR
jgi:hypothetical protein